MFGDIFRIAAPIAAGYFAGPAGFAGLTGTGAAIAAGAATGAGIAALSGDDLLGGAITGGLGGMSGGSLGTAAQATAAPTTTTAASNAKAMSGGFGSGTQAASGSFNPALTQSTGLPQMTAGTGAYTGPASMMSQPGVLSQGAMTGQAVAGGGGYNPSAFGRGVESAQAAFNEPGEFLKNLGDGSEAMGAGKLGIMGLGVAGQAGAFDPDMPEYGDDPMSKYDPKRRLNLGAIDTGLKLNRDTGLRLLAEGGKVKKYAIGGLSGYGQPMGPPPEYGKIDVGGSFVKISDEPGEGLIAKTEYEERYPFKTGETSAEQNQAGGGDGGMEAINKAASAGKPNAGAIAALAQGFARQQTQGPTESQTLGLESLEAGGYLETGGEVGDGMSDEIEATIEGSQEARLSDGEFVIPADVVSHLGNGSSDAGARRLYEMMDKVRMARTGTKKQGKEIKPERYMPA